MISQMHYLKFQNDNYFKNFILILNFSLILIGVASTVSPAILEKFLDSVFNAMVLCLGIDELSNIRNPERLKRELRVTYQIIDKLLDCLESGDKAQPSRGGVGSSKSACGDNNEFVETILCQVIITV